MIEVGVPTDGAREAGRRRGAQRCPRRVGVLPLRDTVAFPDMMVPLNIGQPRSVELINDVLRGDRSIVMVAGRDPEVETPGPDELYEVGVLGVVARMIRLPDGSLRVLIQGGQRVRIQEWVQTEPYLVAVVDEAPDVVKQNAELVALMRNVQQTFSSIVEQVPYLPEELQIMVANVEDPSVLSHVIAGALRLSTEEKQSLLEELDVAKRLRRLSKVLARELEVAAIGTRIQSQVQSELEQGQREYFLRQQMKAIQEELGETDEAAAEVAELRRQLEAIELPEEVRKQVDRELGRLERLQPAMAEYGVVRTYLEWIASLPWDTSTEDNLDLEHAREVLDHDHYDIEQVKDRILEFLAVRRCWSAGRGPGGRSCCFVGPPGVGKTSLGRSMARALGRKFERISVGGVRDEAEIRGHRRTYIGAMPGVIIRALRDAGANNPLLMIDEIDKMGAGLPRRPVERDARGARPRAEPGLPRPLPRPPVRSLERDLRHHREHARDDPGAAARPDGGDPARRLHGLGEARDRQALPGPPSDRAQRPVEPPDRLQRLGPARDHLRLHARGGVRQLEREIGSVVRKVARQVAEGKVTRKVTITEPRVRELLGKRRFFSEARRRTSRPGRGHRAGLDAGRGRGAVHRGHGDAGARAR